MSLSQIITMPIVMLFFSCGLLFGSCTSESSMTCVCGICKSSGPAELSLTNTEPPIELKPGHYTSAEYGVEDPDSFGMPRSSSRLLEKVDATVGANDLVLKYVIPSSGETITVRMDAKEKKFE